MTWRMKLLGVAVSGVAGAFLGAFMLQILGRGQVCAAAVRGAACDVPATGGAAAACQLAHASA